MLNLTRLSTLSMDKPLGIGENPYFSWVLESDEQNQNRVCCNCRKLSNFVEYQKLLFLNSSLLLHFN